jgi:hypothetical protein
LIGEINKVGFLLFYILDIDILRAILTYIYHSNHLRRESMEGTGFNNSQGERLIKVVENILKTEAETAGTEMRILMQVETMLETIINLMQMVQPEESQLLIQEENGEDYQQILLKQQENLTKDTFDNFNKISDSLAKVIKSMSDLVGESLDSIGDFKTARVRMIEGLKNIMQYSKFQ